MWKGARMQPIMRVLGDSKLRLSSARTKETRKNAPFGANILNPSQEETHLTPRP